MYGSLWLDKWAGIPMDAAMGQWAASLDRFDDRCIKQALDSIVADGERFPPSLPEFFKRCCAFRPVSKPAALQLAGPRAVPPAGFFEKARAQLAKIEPASTEQDEAN